ncbi:MAG TPA: dihydropteroate synthase [Acidimicrobiia bacterium]|nr:dihydropteroate synthase [Acidimicrobiia bacterium]
MTAATRWALRTRYLSLTTPVLVGVVNVTPDSFSDGGRFADPDRAVARGRELVAQGASVVDVGGESTRPGSEAVSAGVELDRVLPVVAALSGAGVVVSVDTSKAEVAAAALAAGAEIVNDVTALSDPDMARVAAEAGAGLVLMHMLGTPKTMQVDPHYEDVVAEVTSFLVERAGAAERHGVAAEAICIDPGIGFGKTFDDNLTLLAHLELLVATGYPVMVGTSRKSFLGRITGVDDPELRDPATEVTVALAVEQGVQAFRVHEIPGARQAVLIAEAIVRAR